MPKKIVMILFFVGFLSAVAVMGFVLSLEYRFLLAPCSLCIFQRVAVLVAMIVFLIGAIHMGFSTSTRSLPTYVTLGVLIALIGLVISLRQIYLQSLPPREVPACGPGFNFIFKAYPFLDALKIIFQGSGECAKVGWRGLGLSLADWAGLYFVGLVILNILAAGLNRINKTANK